MKLSKTGFTLMELMIVIIILGILVTIATPMYYKSIERARMAEAVNNLGAIRSSEHRYYAAQAKITTFLNDLDVGNPIDYVGPGQVVRFGTYTIAGGSLGVMNYICQRDTSKDYTGIGLPGGGYTVTMNATGSVTSGF